MNTAIYPVPPAIWVGLANALLIEATAVISLMITWRLTCAIF